jgi:hypothetical protein
MRSIALVCLAGGMFLVFPNRAWPQVQEIRADVQGLRGSTEAIASRTAIQETLTTKSIARETLGEKRSFVELLRLLEKEMSANKSPCVFEIDPNAFGAGRVEQTSIEFPTALARLPLRTALAVALSQLPGDATYVVTNGKVSITRPLRNVEELAVRDFSGDGSLEQVLSELSNQMGVDIIVDRRVSKAAKLQVRLKIANPTNLSSVLTVLTDMCGISYVPVDQSLIYVTSSKNAQKMRK